MGLSTEVPDGATQRHSRMMELLIILQPPNSLASRALFRSFRYNPIRFSHITMYTPDNSRCSQHAKQSPPTLEWRQQKQSSAKSMDFSHAPEQARKRLLCAQQQTKAFGHHIPYGFLLRVSQRSILYGRLRSE
jgi:hypothetical protein